MNRSAEEGPRELAGRLRTSLPLVPLIVAVAVVPLVVFLKFVPCPKEWARLGVAPPVTADYFSYYKMVVLLACAAASAGVLVLRRAWIPKTAYTLLLGLLAVAVLSSAAHSPFTQVAFFGAPGRCEGALAWISYVILALTAMTLIRDERDMMRVLCPLCVSAAVIGVIAILQAAGRDPFLTAAGRAMILPAGLEAHQGSVALRLPMKSVYATLFNPNYLGSYMAMMLPLSLGLFALTRKLPVRAALTALAGLCLCALLLSRSRAGLAGAMAGGIVLLAAALPRGRSARIWIGAVILGLVVVCALPGPLRRHIQALLPSPPKGAYPQRVLVEGSRITYRTSRETLVVSLKDANVAFADERGSALLVRPGADRRRLQLADDRYADYSVDVNRNNVLLLRHRGYRLKFIWTGERFALLNGRGAELDTNPATAETFRWWQKIGSGRLYIWQRAVSMMGTVLFLGCGPDCFAAYFPQTDVAPKLFIYGTVNVIVDKAHSLYLQMAVNTGLPSLVALLAVFVGYGWESLRLYVWRPSGHPLFWHGLCFYSAFCGYAVAGLFNDSVVAVAPVFWVLLGMGIVVNWRVKSERI